jgi:hypothetical protein
MPSNRAGSSGGGLLSGIGGFFANLFGGGRATGGEVTAGTSVPALIEA